MRKSYKKQILDYNVEKSSLMVKDNIDIFSSTKILIQASKNTILQINFINCAKKIRKELNWYIEKNERLKLRHNQLNYNY